MLWRALAEGADLPDTRPGWMARLGPDFDTLGPLLEGSTHRAGHWPCGLGLDYCWRRLVEEGDGFLAVCVDEDRFCKPDPVRRADAWLYNLNADGVVASIRIGLQLAGADSRRLLPGAWWLGSREFGEVTVGFYLATNPERDLLDAVTAEVEPGVHGQVILLAATEPNTTVCLLAWERGIDMRPLPPMAELREGGMCAFDLDDLLLHHRFRGLEDPTPLLTHRIRLLLHPAGGRVWLDRKPLELRSSSTLAWAFLDALARRPGRDVLRGELLPLVYEEYTPANSGQGWDIKLRQVRSQLPKAPWPMEAISGDFFSGGYRLNLTADQIAWWSDLPPKRGQNKAKRGLVARSGRPGKRR